MLLLVCSVTRSYYGMIGVRSSISGVSSTLNMKEKFTHWIIDDITENQKIDTGLLDLIPDFNNHSQSLLPVTHLLHR